MNSIKRTGALCALIGISCTSVAFAQDPDRLTCADFFLDITNPATEICRGNLAAIPFDLLAPGARSLGLGGAFVAVADDATAAEANPAGQTILTRPEFSVHVRHASYNSEFFDPNELDSNVFGAAGPGPISSFDDSNTKISFLSFVYPFERFVLSGYYQNSGELRANSSITSVDAFFSDIYVAETSIDAEQESFGLSGAFRISDMFSIGASIKHSTLNFQYLTTSSVFGFRDLDIQFPDAGPFQDEITLGSSSFGDDHDMTWNAGLLINPNGKFSAGLVYKEGGSFNVTNRLFARDFASCADAACDVDLSGEAFRSQRLNLPDILSVGIALRPSDTWLLSAQLDRIDYGNLPNGTPTGFLFGAFQGESADIDELGTETSVHLGAEKTLIFDAPVLGMRLLSIRAGGFTDPDHDSYAALDTDDTHFTFGLGTVIGESLQIDLGTEWSDRVDAVVMSAVYHF